jgi:hypothetical protein
MYINTLGADPSRPTWGRIETALLTPGPIQGISSQDGCNLAMHCLPLNITNRYFILRVGVHQLQRPGAGQYRSRVSWKSIIVTPAGGQGSKVVGVACLELGVSVIGDGQFYLSHIGGCAPDHVI